MKFFALFFTLSILVACSSKNPTEEDKALNKKANMFFKAVSPSLIDKDKYQDLISLGEKLYFEKKLSANGTISCNSCHMLDKFGVDNEPTSPGHDGTRGERNSPTVYNAGLNFAQFWDGRAKDLAEQAIGPILNPIEHGLKSEKEAISILKQAGYEKEFKAAKLDLNYKNVGVAIAAFEKTLMTPSDFDDYLNGDIFALNDQERRGLKKFVEVGCTTCHNGENLGGTMYQKLGLVKKYKTEDLGRYKVTKKRRDKYKFKVPGLRNIAKTGPYLHDGSIKTLDEMIDIMAEYQLGKKLLIQDIKDIKAFLSTTTAKSLPY
jgi:cytochrome c peroxidase